MSCPKEKGTGPLNSQVLSPFSLDATFPRRDAHAPNVPTPFLQAAGASAAAMTLAPLTACAAEEKAAGFTLPSCHTPTMPWSRTLAPKS